MKAKCGDIVSVRGRSDCLPWFGVYLGGGEFARLLESGIWTADSCYEFEMIVLTAADPTPDEVLAMSARVQLAGWEPVLAELLGYPLDIDP